MSIGLQVFSFIGGVLIAVIAEHLLWPAMRRMFINPVIRKKRHQRDRKLNERLDGSSVSINGHKQYLFEFAPRGFSSERLSGMVGAQSYNIVESRRISRIGNAFPDGVELLSLYQEKKQELESAESRFWNGSQLALQQITRRRDSMIEEPILTLNFINKDYANFQIIGELFDKLRRDGVLKEFLSRALDQPDPLLATDFGLIINVVTADNRVVVTRRSREAYSWNGFWHIAVAESLTKQDADTGGYIDFHKVVCRALEEELGLKVADEIIRKATTFHSLNVHVSRHSWMLFVNVNLAETQYTFEQIRFLRSSGGGRDHWESNNLRTIEFRRETVLAELIKSEADWIPFGLWCLLLSAIADRVITLDDFREVASGRRFKRTMT
jgi:8-oxo-dGTP pyrophosphatase MutT (NUDIX family)